ncbi:MGDG synthase family glycosyltransferase [Desulfitobacterium metallireducens]|uniref:UDP-N-acetylglucosamine:LPS N-acetylglucosamine transferase n=1 Tax=Desulfitobacterium metallireducens DSM 15288 TaxID=871968 RepID=W0EFI1_9FIRM|nr:glycosyltransferase [Desulfitobacterium metallireducens]AHF07959.1 UDP-N-acetylglucosamine:LPS N-acetylglucosamine transferase [Desulfitobacterium metallireducens DSM 15288]
MGDLRIIVFSASYGAGHVRAAEALIDEIRTKAPSAEITHVDSMAFLSKPLNKVIKSTYIELIKHSPRLWGKFYYRTSKIPPHSVLQKLLNILGRREFLSYIEKLQPDVIICTYPVIAGVLAQLRLRGVLKVPVVTVVTDYAVHSQWIHQGVDLYIVGNNDVFEGLVSRGIAPRTIQITGIPVNPRFEHALDRQEISQQLHIYPDRPVFLIMGGAYGVLGGIKKVCQLLADSEVPVQSLIVCGRDEKLYRSMDGIVAEAKNPMHRFGFVRNVEELMAVSDIIITKAGGLTVSEALTRHLPLLIYKPIPGQEEENAHFIQRIGAGLVVQTEEELGETVHRLLHNPQEIELMRQATAKALPGKAAERATHYIFELINDK